MLTAAPWHVPRPWPAADQRDIQSNVLFSQIHAESMTRGMLERRVEGVECGLLVWSSRSTEHVFGSMLNVDGSAVHSAVHPTRHDSCLTHHT